MQGTKGGVKFLRHLESARLLSNVSGSTPILMLNLKAFRGCFTFTIGLIMLTEFIVGGVRFMNLIAWHGYDYENLRV